MADRVVVCAGTKRGLFFLHKPYTLIQLLEAVHNALHRQSTIVVA